jgi:hypothetical protein
MIDSLHRVLCAGLLGLLPATASVAGNDDCSARTSNHTVALLELFTSEGCSSCPPAEHWLSSLGGSRPTIGKVVPLSLHVDYWDYIGWRDPFAQPGFGVRQRRMAQQSGASAVYTPQFFIQGRSYRPPSSLSAFNADLDTIYSREPRADLALTLGSANAGKLPVKVTAGVREGYEHEPMQLVVVLYENALSSRVTAGENAGATLRHDFVVREWIGPRLLPPTGHIEETVALALPSDSLAGDFGVAAFVQQARSQEVLQALSRQVCQ